MNPEKLFRVFRWRFYRDTISSWLAGALLLQSAVAVAPEWWAAQGVLNQQKAADDYSVANVGQLKNVAHKAMLALDVGLPGGAGDEIHALVDPWSDGPAEGVTRDDYAALTLGQLKAVARPFYDRLAALYVRAAGSYPWSGSANAADDYAVENLGQLKHVFAFDIMPADVNFNGVPDLWEMLMFGNLDQDMDADFEGDGLSNWAEFLFGSDPKKADTDGDGWSDLREWMYDSSPDNASVTPATRTKVQALITYDTDSFEADDGWYITEHSQPASPDYRWQTSHTWYYLEPPGGHWVNNHQATEPNTALRALPTLAQIDGWWLTEAEDSWWLWGFYDASDLNPNDFVPNGEYLPIINRWNETINSGTSTSVDKGWGIGWKRYRLRIHGPLPDDYQENYLQVTYKWDKDNAVPNLWGDGWFYPNPTIKEVKPVKMVLRAGQTSGDWLYVCPQTDGNDEMLSVRLVQVEVNCPELYMFAGHVGDQVTLCRASGACEWKLKDASPVIGTFDYPNDLGCSFTATTPGKNTIQLVMGGNVVWEKPTEVIDIVTRAAWGAYAADVSKLTSMPSIEGITIHHSSSTADGAAEVLRIQDMHMQKSPIYWARPGNGWADISYQFLMDKAGHVYLGRELETAPGKPGGPYVQGAHVENNNKVAGIGICVLGDYEGTEAFPTARQQALEKAISAIARRYQLNSDKVSYHQARATTNQTECPGSNIIPKVPDIIKNVRRNLQ